MHRQTKYIKTLAVLLILTSTAQFAYLSYKSNGAEDVNELLYYIKIYKIVLGLKTVIIGIAFFISSILSRIRLKTYFLEFYK